MLLSSEACGCLKLIRAGSEYHMADDVATAKNVKLFREGTDSSEVDFDASDCSNVAALRGKLEMAGKTCSVNGVIVSNDNLPINDGDRVSFTGGNKTGGQ